MKFSMKNFLMKKNQIQNKQALTLTCLKQQVFIVIFQENFKYVNEELYKTPNGRYFLFGEGGPKTEYFQDVGNGSYSGSSTIIPLTKEEALEWAEKREIDGDIILEEFSDLLDEA